jgi:hypothetical protein
MVLPHDRIINNMSTEFDSFLSTLFTENPDLVANIDTGEVSEWGTDPNITIIFYPNTDVYAYAGVKSDGVIKNTNHGALQRTLTYDVSSSLGRELYDEACDSFGIHVVGVDKYDIEPIASRFSNWPHKEALCARYYPDTKIFSWWINYGANGVLSGYTDMVSSFLTDVVGVNPEDVNFDHSGLTTINRRRDPNPDYDKLLHWDDVRGDGQSNTISSKERRMRKIDSDLQIARHLGLQGKSDPESLYNKVGRKKAQRRGKIRDDLNDFYMNIPLESVSFDSVFNSILPD